MKKRCYIGVDGGASKTYALIADKNGEIIGFGASGGSNHQNIGYEKAIDVIADAVNNAILSTNQSSIDIEFGCFCLSGADFPDDFHRLEESLNSRSLAQKIVVKNDTFAALRAGLSRPFGVVVISGTGFNAAGIGINGDEYSLPGLGQLSGDWGGGQDISFAMIHAIIRQWDGRGKATLLSEMILDKLELKSIEMLLEKLYRREIGRDKLIPLVPLLFRASVQGDSVAKGIVVKAGEEIGVSARAVIRHLDFSSNPFEVVLAGSIFKGEGTLLINTIEKDIKSEFKFAELKLSVYEPVVGALMLCIDQFTEEDQINKIQTLKETLPKTMLLADS